MHHDRHVTKREAFGFGELLSKIGGFSSAIFAIFTAIVTYFGHWNFQAKMIEELY